MTTPLITVSLGGHPLSRVNDVIDLGISYSTSINFASHINNIVSKAKQRIYLLRKCFTNCHNEALVLAYKTYVVPLLEYCSPVWSPTCVTYIVKLEKVQKMFTKSLKGLEDLPYRDRLRAIELETLERRRLNADLVLLYKIIYNLVEIDFHGSLELSETSATRGNKLKLKVQPARLNSRLNFFTLRCIKIWNTLPDSIVLATSVYSFKRALIQYDLNKFLMYT